MPYKMILAIVKDVLWMCASLPFVMNCHQHAGSALPAGVLRKGGFRLWAGTQAHMAIRQCLLEIWVQFGVPG